MAGYTQYEFDGLLAMNYLCAVRRGYGGQFRKKYKMNFLKALRTIEDRYGTDIYEVMLFQDYPMLISTQAYYRKVMRCLRLRK